MRISDWSSDVCSSDLGTTARPFGPTHGTHDGIPNGSGNAMADRIVAESLSTFEISPDGSTFALHVTDRDGRTGALVLPADCLRQLVMTMPRIADEEMRARSIGRATV